MFNFFKKKKNIDTSAIKNFKKALNTIGDFIVLEDFDKATKAINEVIQKENDAFNDYINKIEEKEKSKEIKKFKRKIQQLYDLKKLSDTKKANFEKKQFEKRKSQELKNINQKIKEYIWKRDFYEAINLLNTYLERNKSDIKFVNFANFWKKKINFLIERDKKQKEKEIKKDTLREARELIWEIRNENIDILDKNDNSFNLLKKFKWAFFIYKNLKKRLKEKRLVDEINILLQAKNEESELIIKSKLASIHSWFSKKISWEKINWFELYWQILWADKISWDTMWFSNTKNDYKFFIWDATWHGIRAWFIVTQLTKKFHEISKKSLEELTMDINNSLKQELKSWNFITSIFFSIDKKNIDSVKIVWMWHEPIFVFRKKSKTVEKIIPWWLAAWIRLIKDIENVKSKNIDVEDWDILLSYSDWIVEAKSPEWVIYWIQKLWETFRVLASNNKNSIEDIHKKLLEDLKNYTWKSTKYLDDVTIVLLKRDKSKEVLDEKQKIEEFIKAEWLNLKQFKKINWKTKEEALEEIRIYQKQNALKNIIKTLDNLYRIWELPKLKQECIRYIKEWFIHKKLNFYLKQTIEQENTFKIKQRNKKVQDKYNVLKELYKKWDFETVIVECSNIIAKDWNI